MTIPRQRSRNGQLSTLRHLDRSGWSGPVRHAITREIWGDPDLVLLVFAGAAAEFALNRAADWLFFTGALPRDPVGRLFRTVHYARGIAFAAPQQATRTLEGIRAIHLAVERARGQGIPGWAHRAVLYMLIDYSERAARLVGATLGSHRQEELYGDFRRIGEGLGIEGLPADHASWRTDRARSMTQDLARTASTVALYAAYRRRLGPWRFTLLRHLQAALVPPMIAELLELPTPAVGKAFLSTWRATRTLGLGPAVRRVALPPSYWSELSELERPYRTNTPP